MMEAVVFPGEGELAKRCRSFDWGATHLGPVGSWPASLRTTASIVLSSAFPSIVLWGPELVQIYNDGYAPIMGDKHPWGLGKPTREVWPEVWDINGPIYDRVNRGETVAFENRPYPLRRRGPASDPEDVFLTISYSPVLGETGSVAGVLVTMFDTTRQVAARELEIERDMLLEELSEERAKLEEVFRLAPSFLALLRGRDHVFEMANDAYYQLVGHRDIIGKPIREALPEVRGQGFIDLLDRVLMSGEPFIGREVPVSLARSEGKPDDERYVNFVYQRIRGSGEVEDGVLAHGSDVTEQVLARRAVDAMNTALRADVARQARDRLALEAARAEAEEANRAKSQFLTTMSHELRTPLNAIAGYSDLLLGGIRGKLSAAQIADVERIKRSGQHLLSLINDILNFAKIEAGQVEFCVERAPVSRIITGLDELVAPRVAVRGLRITIVPADSSLFVHGDVEKLRQILLNLLSNAVKFTDSGGEIVLSADGDDEAVRISVRDTGRGISPGQLATIFDPFVQVDRHLTPSSQQGVGLGLAISRDLARRMNGDLTVESTSGTGSTFTLTLPRAA
ncbi:MAG TPA: ATP-binding protein [Gemmatimonadaceae bacterium]|nr:ATP-binding protein [Gemmatimonadaceae bacterium]